MSPKPPTTTRPYRGPRQHTGKRGGQRALSLSEVLISLAITSMLLTAIAAAFSSSASVVENNDRFFRATQSARVALNQILTEVRRCDTLDVSGNRIDVIRPNETRPANEKLRSYKYDPAAQRIVLFFTYLDDTTSGEYPLASDVLANNPFGFDMGVDANNAACVTRVALTLEVKVGENHIRVSGSAAPRRNLTFK